MATLSSALGDAVRQHRLTHNPARPAVLPRPPTAERRIWTAEEATRFLRYCHHTDPLIADVCELLIGTGMRKGEALALHWHDVHLNEGVLYVRYTLSAINNARLVITSPKTRSSKNWVAISPRVAAALTRRAADAPQSALVDRSDDPFTGLVFCRPDGRPLRPQTVLDRFRRRAKEAGIPCITLHDLRHLAATLSITAGTPLTVVSKTLRHSTLSTTANLYSHLTQQAAHDAVDAIDTALAQADPTADSHPHWPAWLRPHRDHPNGHRACLTLPYAPPHPKARMRPPCDRHAAQHEEGRFPISGKTASDLRKRWSGRQYLNLRPLAPPSGAATLRDEPYHSVAEYSGSYTAVPSPSDRLGQHRADSAPAD
ncbi:site-specific integrase, partial [Streptomyces albiflaviniger]|nr:site-specific integrase [Streptomyces albiflaviniger]